ncbi:hypothetical protein VTL71DRAFT_13935 [Oculimacula yallundae]|uniref:Uncharacterized protein n=1 Tax=Oculimacula yallundae TaxID=86028 RepID=A0ABR4CPB1_9HELO
MEPVVVKKIRQGSQPKFEPKVQPAHQDSRSAESEPLDREPKSKREIFHISRKWPLSGSKKKVPAPSGLVGSGERERELQPGKAQRGGGPGLESADRPRETSDSELEKLNSIERTAHLVEAHEKIKELEAEVRSLHKERDQARKLNNDLLKALPPDVKGRVLEGISTRSSPDPTKHQKEVYEALELLNKPSRKLEDENTILRVRLDEVEFNLKTKSQECDDTIGSLERLEEENKTLSTQLSEARKQEAEASIEQSRIRKELNRIVQDKATTLAVLDAYYADDIYFQKQFSTLRSSIKDWASRAFGSILPTKNRPPASSVTVLSRISKDWETYMDSDIHRTSFIQAYVWEFLLRTVFGGEYWELPSSSIKHTKNVTDKNPRDNSSENQKLYRDLRSAEARFAVPVGTEAQAKRKITASGLHQHLDDLITPIQFWSVMGDTQSRHFALQIVTDAILLDIRALQQKAEFVTLGMGGLWQKNGGLYASNMMEIRYGKQGSHKEQLVCLVSSPLLGKKSDSQGRAYDQMAVIEKAQVDVDVPRKKRSFLPT